jgi:uncharacterized protein (DUF2384 family)
MICGHQIVFVSQKKKYESLSCRRTYAVEVRTMREYMPFAAMEQLLLTTVSLPGSSIKSIAATTGIQTNTLYKWKTTPVHLSPEKADKLLMYFMEHEPDRLELAELVLSQKHKES